jgi:hypothetical protein
MGMPRLQDKTQPETKTACNYPVCPTRSIGLIRRFESTFGALEALNILDHEEESRKRGITKIW